MNKLGITEYLKNLIINMFLLGKEQRINLKKIPGHKWFKYYYIQVKHDKNERNEKSERKIKISEKSERNEKSVKIEKIS